ncbi:uncharacterized protein LOC109845700 [Asparagus officinalis]|uniref:uncharacterized protein LOC109845700 n=1 Tax=Asparagus officinalis TaxID=4686 RepID=UPI00098E224B|nr:uncharacterized protein LOC109845700 [Asparagus officinalis]
MSKVAFLDIVEVRYHCRIRDVRTCSVVEIGNDLFPFRMGITALVNHEDFCREGAEFIFFLQTSSIVFLSRAPYPKEIRFFVCSFLAENFHFSLGFLPPPSSSDLDSWIGDFKPLDLDLQCLRVDLVPGGAVLVHSIVRRRSPRHPLPRLHFSGWNFPRVAFLLTPTPDVVGRFSLPLLLGRLLAHFLGSTGIVQMTLAVRYRKEGAIACANLSQMPPSPLILLPLRF